MSKKADKLDGFAPGARPICVFCNAPWSDDMIRVFNKTTVDAGYYYGELDGVDVYTTVKIDCHKCGRLIYQKEIETRSDGYR